MIELVIVMVILGVLSVVVAPRPFNGETLNARAFHDETLSFLRYAQKTAVAQRRTVCLVFTAESLELRIAAQGARNDCATDLTGPQGEYPALLMARAGTTYDHAPNSFSFNGLGQPVDAAGAELTSQSWRVARMGPAIVVESDTGYAHD